jgi:hypothetical protein
MADPNGFDSELPSPQDKATVHAASGWRNRGPAHAGRSIRNKIRSPERRHPPLVGQHHVPNIPLTDLLKFLQSHDHHAGRLPRR